MAERFNEADVYAALGMEAPAEQPEAADRANGLTGENVPETTEPAGAGDQDTDRDALPAKDRSPDRQTEAENDVPAEDAGKPDDTKAEPGGEMSKAERARQAQMRRERETQARIDAALNAEREKHKADLKKIFEKAGMTDRYNGNKPITSMEEFDAWDKAGQAAGLSRRLQEGKLTAEDFQRAVDNSPAVQEARAAVQRLNDREQETRKQEYQQLVERELEEIRQLDPGVTSLQDILNRDTGPEFSRLVTENHLTFTQAFKLANADRLAKAQLMAAEEGRARARHGKDHMRTSVSTGSGGEVPRAVVEVYRQLDPDMTMDEIRKDYAKRTPGVQ